MRWGWVRAGILLLALAAFGADDKSPCKNKDGDTSACAPSKKDLKQAKAAYKRGLKLQDDKRTAEALDEFEKAARLAPMNAEYALAQERLRQQLVFEHVERGNASLRNQRQVEALAEFGSALSLDPDNQFAQQRIRDAVGWWPAKPSLNPQVLANAGELRVQPNTNTADFHFRGDSRALLTQVASAFGLAVVFDDSVSPRPARFDITGADFYTAMQAAGDVTKTFWTPLTEKQVLIAAESPANHRSFDRMALRTFYLPGLNSAKDLNEIVNLLRNVFEIRFAVPQPQSGTIVVRAPTQTLDAATHLLESLDDIRPQVMLEVRVYQVSHMLMRNMGLQLPNQFQMFNIPAGALALLGGQNIQDLINDLIANGGINQANSDAIQALLAQLQNQQSSLFSQPIVTFGNGLTLMGLTLGTAGAQMSLNESWVKTLEHAYLRSSQGDDTVFRIGTRYPILNATFAPIFNTPAISQAIQDQSFQPAFPSFNYEDLGLNLKAKPTVNRNSVITLQLELQFRALQGQSLNGVPVISNREYTGTITLRDGEPAVVAGTVSRSESRSMGGIPGLGSVPGLNKIATSNGKQQNEDELLVVITPRVVSGRPPVANTEVWLKQ